MLSVYTSRNLRVPQQNQRRVPSIGTRPPGVGLGHIRHVLQSQASSSGRHYNQPHTSGNGTSVYGGKRDWSNHHVIR